MFVADYALREWFVVDGHVSDSQGIQHVAAFYKDYSDPIKRELRFGELWVSGKMAGSDVRVYMEIETVDLHNSVAWTRFGKKIFLMGPPLKVGRIYDWRLDPDSGNLIGKLEMFAKSESPLDFQLSRFYRSATLYPVKFGRPLHQTPNVIITQQFEFFDAGSPLT